MKKLLTLLFTLAISIGNAQAAQVGVVYPTNDDSTNALIVVSEIRDLYITTIGFPNLDTLDIKRAFPRSELNDKKLNELKSKFSFSTKDNGNVAIIKYKVKSCDNMKYVKDILIEKTLITEAEPVSCKNNVWTAELNN